MQTNQKCLVITHGFFGDILFATSLASKLREEQGYVQVDYLIGFPQMLRLVQNNPHIDNVFVSQAPSPAPQRAGVDVSSYDRVVQLGSLGFETPPAYEYQKLAGIQNPTSTYEVYTEPSYDTIAQKAIEDLKEGGKKVLAIMSNWEPKTYLFTPEQYKAGIDVPNLGYGGSHRNIGLILSQLKEEYVLLEVGVPPNVNQIATSTLGDNNQKSILFEASLMKYCDAFVGTEGGLANIAAGVGTKTIITGDFNLQLYGWNGVLKQIKEPKLGPVHYFPEEGHVVLDPYLTDEEVITMIQTIL